jgi:hypothetical protein
MDDINIFETAGLADQFNLRWCGKGFDGSADLADFLLCEENDSAVFVGLRQFLWRWAIGECVPTAATWEAIAREFRRNEEVAPLLEWAVIPDPADFIYQALRYARFMAYGVK